MTKAIASVVLVLAGALALAAPSEASIDGREREQRQRIRQARQSGALTHHEAARLAREQRQIRREERRFRANDGHLDPRERARLNHDLNRASRDIYRQKHDGQQK
jgi:uncharacterized membrane protein YebE (DUF533 family)